MQYRTFPPPTLPGPPPSPEAPAELPELSRRCHHHREARGPRLSILRDGSWRSGLARRKGVSETAGAQVGFAKRLITGSGMVPTSLMVS